MFDVVGTIENQTSDSKEELPSPTNYYQNPNKLNTS
jgi:hypothetical protein